MQIPNFDPNKLQIHIYHPHRVPKKRAKNSEIDVKILQKFQSNVFLTPYEDGIYGFLAYLDQN